MPLTSTGEKMDNILLVDVDSHIPNIALMKLATHHKELGDEVELQRLGLTGYPKRKQSVFVRTAGYDRVYASMVFTVNRNLVRFEPYAEGCSYRNGSRHWLNGHRITKLRYKRTKGRIGRLKDRILCEIRLSSNHHICLLGDK